MKFSKIALLAGVVATTLGVTGVARAASGLNGSYYEFDSTPGTIANTQALIAASSGPTATFTATTVCFPSCDNTIDDGSTLAQFLDGNATNISPNAVTDLSDHGVVLTGFLNITTSATYDFELASDDGSGLWIDGSLFIDNDGDHGFQGITNSIMLSAGLHPIEVLQFEDGGVTGLSLWENGNPVGGDSIVTGGVPEPSTWTMMMLGFVGFVFAGHRKATKSGAFGA
jgi:PA14 domain/PEP-CTERM motif